MAEGSSTSTRQPLSASFNCSGLSPHLLLLSAKLTSSAPTRFLRWNPPGSSYCSDSTTQTSLRPQQTTGIPLSLACTLSGRRQPPTYPGGIAITIWPKLQRASFRSLRKPSPNTVAPLRLLDLTGQQSDRLSRLASQRQRKILRYSTCG